MICRMEEPITTKMKKPSMTGPTAKPYLDFSLALMSTRPRLWMFLWNLAEEAAKTRLEAAMISVKVGLGGGRGSPKVLLLIDGFSRREHGLVRRDIVSRSLLRHVTLLFEVIQDIGFHLCHE